ncbi:uncharacterized protein [Epargyreus clarus]|uniref:uncharacterized protein n=1 Tax=Epargyreus clarus TaxID=520877 RepID=UPI003C2D6CF0
MQIICVICSEVINQNEDIHATKCGHIFHYQCLVQWIDISHTCPQCRNPVTRYCTFRLYLTMENPRDVALLESKLESIQLELETNKELAKKKEEENSSVINDLLTTMTNMKEYETKVKDQEKEIVTLQQKIKEYDDKLNTQSQYILDMHLNTQKHLEDSKSVLTECEAKLTSRELEVTTIEGLMGELLKTCEEKLISRKLAVTALEEEMKFIKQQNSEIAALKKAKGGLEEKLDALNGRFKKLAVRTVKRQKQKRKATDDDRLVKRKRSSIYSAIDDSVVANDSTGCPSKPTSSRLKKAGKKSGNTATNSQPTVFWKQPKIEFSEDRSDLPNECSNVFGEDTECDMLNHMQFRLQIC